MKPREPRRRRNPGRFRRHYPTHEQRLKNFLEEVKTSREQFVGFRDGAGREKPIGRLAGAIAWLCDVLISYHEVPRRDRGPILLRNPRG